MAQDNSNRTLWIGIAVAVFAILFLYLARHVAIPFFIAFALAYLMDPVVDKMESWNISRTVSVVILLLVFFSICLGAGLLLFPVLQLQAENLAKNLPKYIQVVQDWLKPFLERFAGMDHTKIQEFLNEGLAKFGELPLKILGFTSKFLWDSVSNLFSVFLMVFNLVIIPVAMFYLLRDFDIINAKLLGLVPERLREKTLDIVGDIDRVLASFVRGQLMVALSMGGLYALGLYFCQTPLSLSIGFAAGIANLVPYLGVIVGFVPAAVLTYLQTQDWMLLLGVVGVFAAVQTLEGMVLTPRILGDNVGLHPVAVLFAVLLGGDLFGLVGIILGVPVVAVLNVLLRRGIQRYKQSRFFSG